MQGEGREKSHSREKIPAEADLSNSRLNSTLHNPPILRTPVSFNAKLTCVRGNGLRRRMSTPNAWKEKEQKKKMGENELHPNR